MIQAVRIVQADMREFSRAGYSVNSYRDEHAIAALIAADMDPRTMQESPALLISLALFDLCWKALEQ